MVGCPALIGQTDLAGTGHRVVPLGITGGAPPTVLGCFGTREAYLAIRSDDQLENRFEPFLLPAWEDGPEFGRLLASFEAVLAGGIGGHMLQLRTFDDQSRPVIAGTNVPAILRSPALAVLGHSVSATSVVAGARYKAGRIAAIAGNASSDELTQNNPYYFQPCRRTAFRPSSWPTTSGWS